MNSLTTLSVFRTPRFVERSMRFSPPQRALGNAPAPVAPRASARGRFLTALLRSMSTWTV